MGEPFLNLLAGVRADDVIGVTVPGHALPLGGDLAFGELAQRQRLPRRRPVAESTTTRSGVLSSATSTSVPSPMARRPRPPASGPGRRDRAWLFRSAKACEARRTRRRSRPPGPGRRPGSRGKDQG